MKTCPACGAVLPDEAGFCTECGAALSAAEAETVINAEAENIVNDAAEASENLPIEVHYEELGEEEPEKGGEASEEGPGPGLAEEAVPVTLPPDSSIIHTADGKYRWVYEEKLLLDFEYLVKWLRLSLGLGCAGLIAWIVLGVMGKKAISDIFAPWKIGLYILAALVVIPLILHIARAAKKGWKRVYLFEMDDKGFINAPQEKGVTKATAEEWTKAMVGLNAGSSTTAGSGFLQATQNIKKTNFDKVRSVRALRSRHQITVKEAFSRNELLVEDKDMDFVWSYVTSRSKRAKVR
ncbi:MAG: zinc ribbon domain-containing protein [Firmicutes bacterium]|nr:zinc ribbon domain-containing protein [Bacillota bacterium]